jgi:5-methylcytosine-specific restriction protein B
MNTADRSIALIDVALRRRFEFEEMMPNSDVIRKVLVENAGEEHADYVELVCSVFEALNRRIAVLLDRDHQIGHSYFLDATSMKGLHRALYGKVLPLLQEYFYNDAEHLRRLLGPYEPDGKKGFVAPMEEYKDAFGEEVPDEELPWKFHVYPPDELEAALRKTFLGG